MRTCESCGTELPEGTKFCFHCGTPVTESVSASPDIEAIAAADQSETSGASTPSEIEESATPFETPQVSATDVVSSGTDSAAKDYNPYASSDPVNVPQNQATGSQSNQQNYGQQGYIQQNYPQEYGQPNGYSQNYSQPQYGQASYNQPQYGQSQYPQNAYPYPQGYQAPPRTDPKSVVSLVMGILSLSMMCAYGTGLLFGIIGIVTGVLAKKEVERNCVAGQKTSSGITTAGLVCSIIGTVISGVFILVLIIMVIVSAQDPYVWYS